MPNLKNKRKITERLSVSVTGNGEEKLLGVVALSEGTGEAQAEAIYQLLQEWNLSEKVQFACADTTNTNSGCDKGACVLLGKKIRKPVPFVACRHHMIERVAASAFEILNIEKSSAPTIKIF